MAETQEKDYVVFENSLGETISNDPRWHAEKLLADSGVENDKDAEIERLRAQLASIQAGTAGADDALEADDGDKVDENGARTYEELDGKALKALAKERQVDISGLTKVGEVRQALIAADAAK